MDEELKQHLDAMEARLVEQMREGSMKAIETGKYRTRDGGVADVEAQLNSGMWIGAVKDMFNQPMIVEWTREGRISPIYDSRWDLMEKMPEASA